MDPNLPSLCMIRQLIDAGEPFCRHATTQNLPGSLLTTRGVPGMSEKFVERTAVRIDS